MPSKEWRKQNPEKQKALAKVERARRWARVKNDPEKKSAANARVRAWYSVPENKAKQIARQGKKWRSDPEFRRQKQDRNLLALYGITLEQKQALFEKQGASCAICKSNSPVIRWHLDHCHRTKRVRGILCNNCNLMIGHAKDNPQTLIEAANYLGHSKAAE